MEVVVIGFNGQLASELRFLSDRFSTLRIHFLPQTQIDILNYEKLKDVLMLYDPKFIINCAAYTAVDKAENESDIAKAINADAILNLGRYGHEYNCHLVHISTDFVFDGHSRQPYKEDDQTAPLSVYGHTKLLGEENLKNSGCSYTLIRTSWVYSSFGNNFVKTMMKLGKERESISVVNDQVGSPTYARDLAEFILSNLLDFGHFRDETYHYSNSGEISWFEFASEVMHLAHLECKVIPISSAEYPTLAKRPSYSVMDKSKIISHYNIELKDWKDSLKECIELLSRMTLI